MMITIMLILTESTAVFADLCIQNLSQHLKQYITHCFKCLHYQTARHVSYRALQLIVELPISFHIITADFILELSKITSDLNAVITIICKFFKKMEFILSKIQSQAQDLPARSSRFNCMSKSCHEE